MNEYTGLLRAGVSVQRLKSAAYSTTSPRNDNCYGSLNVKNPMRLLWLEIERTSMNPRVKDVKPNADYTLMVVFENSEVRLFDVKPYLQFGIFRELQDMAVFNSVRPFLGSVQWQGGQDFCPDTLYLDGMPQAGEIGRLVLA
ncbi:MAG: DUF2442 domain-containing protein [Anaerolineales bacterium]